MQLEKYKSPHRSTTSSRGETYLYNDYLHMTRMHYLILAGSGQAK